MNPTEFWTLALSICGAAQCFFLACCFGLAASKDRWAPAVPALLMFLLGIRILKSVIYLLEGEGMSVLFMNLGFAAHLGAATLLYLYLRTPFLKKPISIKEYLWHLSPSITLGVLSPWLQLESFWYMGAYYCLLLGSLIYWLLSLKMVLDMRREKSQVFLEKKNWWGSLLAGTGIFFFAYFANYILGVISYSTAPVIYSLAIFPVGISAWRNFHSILKTDDSLPERKYQNLSLSRKELEEGKMAIIRALEKEKAYLEPAFSLQHLSERTQIPPHLLSHILNQYLNTNFSSLVNTYRINEACRLLRQPDQQRYTIAAIAFEVGFHSLSVFNNHFKKLKGTTPSAFRKEIKI